MCSSDLDGSHGLPLFGCRDGMRDDGIQRRRNGNGQEIAKHHQVSQGAVSDQSEFCEALEKTMEKMEQASQPETWFDGSKSQ